MKTVYLALGSNLGDRELTLQRAVDQLHSHQLRIKRLSPVYETEPADLPDQRWFLNMVVETQCELFPMQLLSRILRIELALGRKRIVSKGPRTIDIDILLYGAAIIDSSRLTVPHARLHERRFVLQPMIDLAPDLRHPALRVSMKELLARVAGQQVKRVAFAPSLPDPLE